MYHISHLNIVCILPDTIQKYMFYVHEALECQFDCDFAKSWLI